MGIQVNKKLTLQEKAVMVCPTCKREFSKQASFCTQCGQKLKKQTTKVYANVTQRGISSVSVKTPQGTINSKGNVTIPLGKGVSYTTKAKKKK